MISLRHADHEPLISTQIDSFASGAPDQGTRFERDSHITETIARGEYHWKTGKNDWQVSLERAVNALDQRGSLATLDPRGNFVPVPFPGGVVWLLNHASKSTKSVPTISANSLRRNRISISSALSRPSRRFLCRPKMRCLLSSQCQLSH